jgi:prepilin peptidase CpaA
MIYWGVLLLQGGALVSLVLAAACDLRARVLPNGLVLCVAMAGTGLRVLINGVHSLLSLAIALVILATLVGLARRGHIGGGDAKMIAATTLLVPPTQVLPLVTVIALAGGALAIMYFVGRIATRFVRQQYDRAHGLSHSPLVAGGAPAPLRPSVNPLYEDLPYGLAILAGTMLIMLRRP